MAQVPATRYQSSSSDIDYTPGSAVVAGDVIVLGDVVGIATQDIATNAKGSLALEGVFKVPQITGANAVGTLIYWDPAGDPVGGTSGTGAATSTACYVGKHVGEDSNRVRTPETLGVIVVEAGTGVLYGSPCEAFCPAQVYNIVKDEKTGEFQRIQVDFSNCVHCKTCDIRDPYQAINWVCPEGGGGPMYDKL